MAKRGAMAGAALAALVAAYFSATRLPHSPTQARTVVEPSPPVNITAEPVSAAAIDETAIAPAQPSLDDRAAAVEAQMASALAIRYRDEYVALLVANGLAASDSVRIVDAFLAGLAACNFEATRNAYEAYGLSLEEFVSGAEQVWSVVPEEYRSVSVEAVAAGAPHCAAGVSQQAGIPIAIVSNRVASASPSEDFGIWATPNLLTGAAGSPGSAPADEHREMETKILAHVAAFPSTGIADLRIKCEERGCLVLMLGNDIEAFQFGFDRFAEANGFGSALLGGNASRRIVRLRR